MNILVPFKRVPDPNSDDSPGNAGGARWVVNYFDEIAIEEALRIRERGEAENVVAVTVAPPAAEEQIRSVMAMGVDRALRVDDARDLDPYAVARILQAVVRKENPDLVLMGKQAVDDDASQVGPMLAALLQWPQATFVSKIEFPPGTREAICTRETDRGLEVVAVKLPAVVTADLRLNEPRYVSLPGLMKARRKPIDVLDLDRLAVLTEPKTVVLDSRPASRRKGGIRVESVDDLLQRLRERDRVI